MAHRQVALPIDVFRRRLDERGHDRVALGQKSLRLVKLARLGQKIADTFNADAKVELPLPIRLSRAAQQEEVIGRRPCFG
jgi:hypothetical protein